MFTGGWCTQLNQGIVFKCWNYNNDDKIEPSDIRDLEISESGILRNISRCEVFGTNFKIFPRIQGNVQYQRNISSLHIPTIQGMLTIEEGKLLGLNANVTFSTLTSLRNELGNDSVEIRLNHLLNELKATGVDGITVDSDYSKFIFILVLSVIVTILCVGFICCRYNATRNVRFWSRQHIVHTARAGPPPSVVMSTALQDLVPVVSPQ